MGIYNKNVVYCPVCGLVAILKQNVLGETVFPEHLMNGKCRFCNHELCQINETYEEIATPENPSWVNREKTVEEIRQFVSDNYIFHCNNSLFNKSAFEKREQLERQEHRRVYQQSRLQTASSQVRCPRCNSTSISTQKKGFGVGKAAAGVLTVGTPGALAGAIGANKVYNICQNCGHKWEPGK